MIKSDHLEFVRRINRISRMSRMSRMSDEVTIGDHIMLYIEISLFLFLYSNIFFFARAFS